MQSELMPVSSGISGFTFFWFPPDLEVVAIVLRLDPKSFSRGAEQAYSRQERGPHRRYPLYSMDAHVNAIIRVSHSLIQKQASGRDFYNRKVYQVRPISYHAKINTILPR